MSGISSALLLAAGLFIGLIAEWIKKDLDHYRSWIWGVFAAAIVLTFLTRYMEYSASHNDTEEDSATQDRPFSSPTSLHQLPSPPRDFTGREEELRVLREKVKKCGIAISGLHGQGGVGKTVLALTLAEELTPRYPDAQIYLDLKGVSQQPVTPAEAMARVIRAFDVTASLPENEDQLSALYRSVLHGKRVLLLYDNAADAEQVLPLLPPEGCLALVTSRQHFDLPGCYTRNLDVMSKKDARELVLSIAPRIGDRADDLAKLCGYLPFALRNVASALNTRVDLTVASYMERLSDAKKRADLVEASLSLSYDLLAEKQQQQWRMLGVFPGSFDAAAAASVWEVEQNEAEDDLGELLLRSMVKSQTEGRYRLHDLSRAYADSKVSKIERATALRRHAEHYVNVARATQTLYDAGGESVLAGLGLFDLERGNIEAGHRWASKHGQHRDEAARSSLAYALGCAHVLALRLQPEEQVQWLNSALQAARRLRDRMCEAAALGNLGVFYRLLGEYRRAIEFHEQSFAISREIGDREGEASSLCMIGVAYEELGEHRRAIQFYEHSLAIAREICNRRGEALTLGNIGSAYHSLGEYRRAIKFCTESLAIAHEMGDRLVEANALWNVSLALNKLGEHAQAIPNAQAALAIYEQMALPDATKVRRALAEWQGEA